MKITRMITIFKKNIWFVIILLLAPSVVLGQQQGSGNPPNTPTGSGNPPNTPTGSGGDSGSYIFQNPIKANSLPQLINDLFDAIIQIGYVFVVFALIFAGFKFVVARGNPEKLTEAKRIFLYTLIGGVILLGAQVIGDVICNTAAQFNTKLQCKS
ncbi:MAG: pilin [bacterium]